jgi:16S rRNA (uracil1498-N3)-methyltransferase
MQYIFNEDASQNSLVLTQELYKYLVKVRRFKEGEKVAFRNLKDDYIYYYKIEKITKKEIFLSLFEKVLKKNSLEKELEIFWCVIDVKVIEKTLPFLNQIGVKKITFIYCDRSQKNFKLDFEKFKKIVINSNQQSGRVHLMEFDLEKS